MTKRRTGRRGQLVRITATVLGGALLAGCNGERPRDTLQGYVEGDFVLVGAESSGRLVALDVAKGQAVDAGTALFALDDRDETVALAEAEAREAGAVAQLADLKTGKRPEEISVLDAQLAEASAALVSAQKTFDRTRDLSTRAVTSAAALDQATADLDTAKARVDAAHQNRAVAELASRPDAIVAAEKNVAALAAATENAKTALARRKQAAPTAGRIEDTYFRVGEIVPAGKAVVSLLPPAGRKVIFYLDELHHSAVVPGDKVEVSCDGCAEGLSAVVSSIASDAEFAPPVLYSTEGRSKLVFRVEARPEGAAITLDPGQPVSVELTGRAQ